MAGRTLCLAVLLVSIWAQAAIAENLRVSRDQLLCVRDNAEKYMVLPDDLITIVLPACPIVDPVEAFRSLAQNNVFKRDEQNDEQLDAILTIQKSSLLCVLKALENIDSDPVNVSTDELCGE